MAVEVRELVIKTTIDNSKKRKVGKNRRKRGDQDAVSQSVDQVMEILRRKKER